MNKEVEIPHGQFESAGANFFSIKKKEIKIKAKILTQLSHYFIKSLDKLDVIFYDKISFIIE